MSNKTIIEFGFRIRMKNYGDLRGCYPPGGGVLKEFLGGDVSLGPWNP